MRELIRKSDDPTTPIQRIRVVEELAGWDTVTVYDEDTTSRSDVAQVYSRTAVLLSRAEARWLRDVLSGLDLGDGNESVSGKSDPLHAALDLMARQVSTLLALVDSWEHDVAISLGASSDAQMIAEARRVRNAYRAGRLADETTSR